MREEAKEFLKNLNIAVIGLGLMGGSFAKRLRERTKCRITAFDCETETLNKALADGVIDAGYTEGNEELKKADLLIMCLSRDNMLSFLRQNAVYLREGQTLTDIIGIKGNSVEAAENLLPSGVDYVPAHPMAGREGFGYDMSGADIFDCANYIIVPNKRTSRKGIKTVKNLARALGCSHISVVTTEEHDRRIAYTSCLPHVLATALVNSPSMDGSMGRFIAGSFKDATRVADINAALWARLLLADKKALLQEIDRFKEALDKVEESLLQGDKEGLEEFLKEAGTRRREMIHEYRKGQHE